MKIDYEEIEQHAKKAVMAVLGPNHPEVDDAVQDSLLRVFKYQDKFSGKCKLSTWVFRIAYNQAMTTAMRKTRAVTLGDRIPKVAVEIDLTEEVEPSNREQVLRKCLLKIGKKERQTIEGTLAGKSAKELCKEIGVSENALYALRSRGQKKLRQIIGEINVD